MVFTLDQIRQLNEAVLHAFDANELEMLLRFKLDLRLDHIVNVNAPFTRIVFDLIEYLTEQKRLDELLKAVLAERPHNPLVRKLAATMGWTVAGPEVVRAVREALPSVDVGAWGAKLAERERQVCRVERDGRGVATGFLIGPDKVLTILESAAGAMINGLPAAAVTCRFDFKQAPDGTVMDEGQIIPLASGDAGQRSVGASRGPGADASASPDASPDADEDHAFAVLRLSSPVGERPVTGYGGPVRGWIPLHSRPLDYEPGTPIFILHYAPSGPVKLLMNPRGILGLTPDQMGVRYVVDADLGSAGAPCFNANWDLIAVHRGRSGGPDERSSWGLRADVIRELIGPGEFDDWITDAGPTADDTAASQKAEPREAQAAGAYRLAAAAQAYFNPATLGPVPPEGKQAAGLDGLLADCALLRLPGRPVRWILRPDVRRQVLANVTPRVLRAARAANDEFPDDPLQRLMGLHIHGLASPGLAGHFDSFRRAVLPGRDGYGRAGRVRPRGLPPRPGPGAGVARRGRQRPAGCRGPAAAARPGVAARTPAAAGRGTLRRP